MTDTAKRRKIETESKEQDLSSSGDAEEATVKMTGKSRRVCVGGNWKCNGTVDKVASLVKLLNEAGKFPENVDVVVAPTALHIGYVKDKVRKDVHVSVQNLWKEPKAGAWTGELTVDLVKDFGINWTILGHSERRGYNHESPEEVATKTKLALEAGLNVIACIGETLQDREADKTMDVCVAQLEPIIKAIPEGSLSRLVLAYEPVWAIGTGKTATPEQAQEVHAALRKWLVTAIGKEEAEAMRIIYGGSVKANNCDELISRSDIDGFLVGGASLTDEFLKIVNSGGSKSKM